MQAQSPEGVQRIHSTWRNGKLQGTSEVAFNQAKSALEELITASGNVRCPGVRILARLPDKKTYEIPTRVSRQFSLARRNLETIRSGQ